MRDMSHKPVEADVKREFHMSETRSMCDDRLF